MTTPDQPRTAPMTIAGEVLHNAGLQEPEHVGNIDALRSELEIDAMLDNVSRVVAGRDKEEDQRIITVNTLRSEVNFGPEPVSLPVTPRSLLGFAVDFITPKNSAHRNSGNGPLSAASLHKVNDMNRSK